MPKIQEVFTRYFAEKGYRPIPDEAGADTALYLLNADSDWISVCSEVLDFPEPETVRGICRAVSSALQTAVLACACYDSDFAFANLFGADRQTDAWVSFGHDDTGCFRRRNVLSPWKDNVSDIKAFGRLLRKPYLFAEEALQEIAPLLRLHAGQCLFSQDCLEEYPEDQLSVLYFALAETGAPGEEPPRLALQFYDLTPCRIGKEKLISAVNRGGASCGIGIAFSGDYAETEEITFENVRLEYGFGDIPRKQIPLTLKKLRTSDGRRIYYTEVPDFPIPGQVKQGLPTQRQMAEALKRAFGVRFTPCGNPRKCLDICVHFIPLQKREAQCGWCVWLPAGSKEAFIAQHNQHWSNLGMPNAQVLNADDYDL